MRGRQGTGTHNWNEGSGCLAPRVSACRPVHLYGRQAFIEGERSTTMLLFLPLLKDFVFMRGLRLRKNYQVDPTCKRDIEYAQKLQGHITMDKCRSRSKNTKCHQRNRFSSGEKQINFSLTSFRMQPLAFCS